MKLFKAILTIIFLFNAPISQASKTDDLPETILSQVVTVNCLKVSPLLSKKCIVFSQNKFGVNFGLVFPGYDWLDTHTRTDKPLLEYNGLNFSVNYCQVIKNKNLVKIYKKINPTYKYLQCSTQLFKWDDQGFSTDHTINNVYAEIKSAHCGELGPEIGDVCIINAINKKTNEYFTLIFDDYDWANKYLRSDSEMKNLVGQNFKIKTCIKTKEQSLIQKFLLTNSNIFNCHVDQFSWR